MEQREGYVSSGPLEQGGSIDPPSRGIGRLAKPVGGDLKTVPRDGTSDTISCKFGILQSRRFQ